MHLRPSFRLGFALPILLIVTLVADVGLRFMPTELYAIRGWEVARRFRLPDAAFEPNKHFELENAYGELAGLGNLPASRRYRVERFTTDAYGYRNPPEIIAGQKPVGAILVGSSFSVGIGMSDEETLSARLTELVGRPVYNAGGLFGELNPDKVRALAKRLKMRDGVVILEYLERFHTPSTRLFTDTCLRFARFGLERACSWFRGMVRVSPLQIAAERVQRVLQNDIILPNHSAARVSPQRLRNGEEMLFWPEDVDNFFAQHDEERAAEYISSFVAELRKDGLETLVMLVPSSYTVYHPLLEAPPPAPKGAPYLDRLEARLREQGLGVMNLRPRFVAHAAAVLDRREYIYLLDDAHWSPGGVSLAAACAVMAWRPHLQAQLASPPERAQRLFTARVR